MEVQEQNKGQLHLCITSPLVLYVTVLVYTGQTYKRRNKPATRFYQY